MNRWGIAVALAALVGATAARSAPDPVAAAFGARESVSDLSMSPDGTKVAFVASRAGQGGAVYTLALTPDAKAQLVTVVDGKPNRLEGCRWVSNDRLVCTIYGLVDAPIDLLPFTRIYAIDANGADVKLLSSPEKFFSRGYQLGGGHIIDWLPDENGSVLISRNHLPDDHTGSRIGSSESGFGVDWVNTRTLASHAVERPTASAADFLSDGRGTVRVMGQMPTDHGGLDRGLIIYSYRKTGSREWLRLGDYDFREGTGFAPLAVDYGKNVVYGFEKRDGREALYSIALDGSMRKDLVFARDDVDVDGLIRIGRRSRVVGVSFATDARTAVYFDPELAKISTKLAKALGTRSEIKIVDSNVDETKLLIFAGSDTDPGLYYVFDRKARDLHRFMVVRPELEGRTLATMRAVQYPAADGTMVPAYLTLPPGKENAKGLPAIVLPHGGPASRDEWGFDWMSQFFAAKGYAVIQPNFRGSAGFGDEWFQKNGFQSWRIAIGDVIDAGRWLVSQGIADPKKLGIFGWSYGGYAALQSAVVAPDCSRRSSPWRR